MDGIIIIDKEKDYTSRDVVNIIGKTYKTKKVGHTGTLDPLATGVLVVCVGKCTKLVEILTSDEKEYIVEVLLGTKTDTLDITGSVLTKEDVIIKKEDIINSLNSFKKAYIQEVPIYSAVKVNGKKLYEYARNKEEVILPKKEVTIKSIELLDYNCDKTTKFTFKCLVTKGTYIRSLINDIAESLNTTGCMTNLQRTKTGIFKLKDSYKIDLLKKNQVDIIPLKKELFNYKNILVDSELENKIKQGSLIENVYKENIVLFYNKSDEVIAIYKKYEKDNKYLKPWKMLA